MVLGAALSYLASWFSERAKWKREYSARWDQQRLAALTEFAPHSRSKFACAYAWLLGMDLGRAQSLLIQGSASPDSKKLRMYVLRNSKP